MWERSSYVVALRRCAETQDKPRLRDLSRDVSQSVERELQQFTDMIQIHNGRKKGATAQKDMYALYDEL